MDCSTFITGVLSGLGGVGVGAGILSFIGKKWIENKFAEELEEFKAAKRKELEDLRYQINTLFNRVIKIHEKEYEVLPIAWSTLHKAKNYVHSFCSPLQSYPDISSMRDSKVRNFLSKNCDWEDYQIIELLESSDRNKYFQEQIQWQSYKKVESSFREFHSYIIDNRIFLTDELKVQFNAADNLMWEALKDNKHHKEGYADIEKSYASYMELTVKIDGIISEIEKLMQERLRYNEA